MRMGEVMGELNSLYIMREDGLQFTMVEVAFNASPPVTDGATLKSPQPWGSELGGQPHTRSSP